MAKYTYDIESFYLGKWCRVTQYASRDYCEGYLDHCRYDAPRNEMRILRSDGKIVREICQFDEVSIGMIAGFPTPEQYERAAEFALEKAANIRKRMAREEARCDS